MTRHKERRRDNGCLLGGITGVICALAVNGASAVDFSGESFDASTNSHDCRGGARIHACAGRHEPIGSTPVVNAGPEGVLWDLAAGAPIR